MISWDSQVASWTCNGYATSESFMARIRAMAPAAPTVAPEIFLFQAVNGQLRLPFFDAATREPTPSVRLLSNSAASEDSENS
jgi:hypothetical protein